jgi:uncharacterized protein
VGGLFRRSGEAGRRAEPDVALVGPADRESRGTFAATIQRGGELMGNPFVHVELMTTDVGKAKSFYGKLFNWKLEDMPIGDMTYTVIRVGEGTGGGLMKNPMPGAPSSWLAYVLVDDVKAATDKARSLGATVMKDVTEVDGIGSFSVITDPTGAMLGLWEPKKA